MINDKLVNNNCIVNFFDYYKEIHNKASYNFESEEYNYSQKKILYEIRSRFNVDNFGINKTKRGITPSEKLIQHSIIDYIKYIFPDIYSNLKIHGSSYFGVGLPDLFIDISRNGKSGLYFEIKTIFGKLKSHQESCHSDLRINNNNVYVIKSFNEFLIYFGYYMDKVLTCIDSKYHNDIHIATIFNKQPTLNKDTPLKQAVLF